MTLYELSDKLKELESKLENCVDEETGEIVYDIDALIAEYDEVAEDKKEKVRNIVALIVNKNADIQAYKQEAERFKAMADKTDNEIKHLTGYLETYCDGETYDFGFAKFSYSTSKAGKTVIDDEEKAVKWLKENHYDDLVKIKHEETVDKTKIKELIKNGTEIPSVSVVYETKGSVKQPRTKKKGD